jgi:hypothetical protein
MLQILKLLERHLASGRSMGVVTAVLRGEFENAPVEEREDIVRL